MTQPPAGVPRRQVSLRDTLASAFSGLRAHLMRTLLTALSMLIANASVIIVVSVALAGRDFVVRQIEGVGANLIYAYYEAGSQVSASEADYINLADVEAVRRQLGPLALGVAGVMTIYDHVFVDGRRQEIRVLGSNEQYRQVRNLRLLAGRFLDEADLADRSKVCLLTRSLAEKMFASPRQAPGRTVKLQDLQFTVVGVFEERVNTFGQSELAADSALIPITVMKSFREVERVDPLYVSLRSQQAVEPATRLVRQVLESRHRPGSVYRVENLAGILDAARNISLAMTVVLIVIAAITLAISGIFIMNIMLVTVTERTKEIGIRMAVGATRKQVRQQFLAEAVCISLMGGLAGVLVGIAAPLLAARFLPQFHIPVSPLAVAAAVAVSGTAGAVFGLLPASRAARLNPVEALRWE